MNKKAAKYVRAVKFSVLSIPLWILMAFLLSKLTPDPLPLWPESCLIGAGIGLGLVWVTFHFGHLASE